MCGTLLRFGEWGRAALNLQLKFIQSQQGPDWRFMAVVVGDDSAVSRDELATFIFNRVMSESR